jgi:polar amino acid transport system permease protein
MTIQMSERGMRESPWHRLPVKEIPLRHVGRWISGTLFLLLIVWLLVTLAARETLQWNVVWEYLFDPQILHGLWTTCLLTLLAMMIGVVLGLAVAVMRMSRNPVPNAIAFAYIWFFRGTPVLVQLIFWFNLSSVFPRVGVGIPFGPAFGSWDTNVVITTFVAALLGLGLHEAAYTAETIRGGIMSVNVGQVEAAAAHGMRPRTTLRRILLPQAMRVVIPPMGNRTIDMLKTTSLVMVIGMSDLLYSVQLTYARNFQTIPLLIVAVIWYLAVVTLLSIGQHYLERHFGKSTAHTRKASLLATIGRTLRRQISTRGAQKGG